MHYLFALFQQLAVSDGGYAPYAAGAIVMAAIGWVLKTTRDVARTLEKIEQYLFGIKGTNGLDSRFTTMREDVDYLLERRVGPADRRRHE